ncbi:hypothetical protein [Hyphomonas sp.]|jgi:hypothetical protein|uniref:hypothetical protein n=1 Tax=Hyphomonas sp. TaxID=87 RepID=UPI000C894D69|nr:hypothetical protein [Hyphomonas sp.]MAL44583.1 hypothetical protein [Hyphomonas sp.]|tara:strand:- start:906 stop:1484 length:579 start_codon:yes stop_codon:yes gene_type:complete
MSFEINLQSDDNALPIDGFIGYTSQGSQDGEIPRASFYISSEGQKTLFDEIKKDGIVIDLTTLKTGWGAYLGNGQPTDWKWNDSIKGPWIEQPGEEYKRGFSVLCMSGTKLLNWTQNGVAVMEALLLISQQCADFDPDSGKLPLMKFTKVETKKFKNGNSTSVPVLTLDKYVDRPFALDLDKKDEGVKNPEF